MRIRWQNLNEQIGGTLGSILRHGRAWMHMNPEHDPVARIEWVFGEIKRLRAELDFDRDDRTIQANLGVPGAWVFLTVPMPRWLRDRLPWHIGDGASYGSGGERTIGIRVHDGAIWLSLWEDSMCWSARDPWWMRATIRLDDLIFGKTKHERRTIETRAVRIPMPEGSYEATAELEVASWTRPRWPWRPFSKRDLYVDIKIPAGIGKPGKGENSWDLGPDACYGMSAKARTIEEGIGIVVASVLRDRVRRGSGHADTGGHEPTPTPTPASSAPAPAAASCS